MHISTRGLQQQSRAECKHDAYGALNNPCFLGGQQAGGRPHRRQPLPARI